MRGKIYIRIQDKRYMWWDGDTKYNFAMNLGTLKDEIQEEIYSTASYSSIVDYMRNEKYIPLKDNPITRIEVKG